MNSVLILVILLIVQCLLTAMYFALANVRRRALKDSGDRRAQQALKLAENSQTLLAAYQYTSLLLSMFIAVSLMKTFIPEVETALQQARITAEWAQVVALVITIPISAVVVMLLGHQFPAAVLSGRVDGAALLVAPLMRLIVALLTPIIKLTQAISERGGRLLGGSGAVTLIEEEIKSLIEAGSQEGNIEIDEKAMIYSVFKFGDTVVREVMVPRIDIVSLEINDGIHTALDKIVKAGHSRIPVYEETIDNIKGFLYAKDLLTIWHEKTEDYDLKKILRDAYFVPESKPADDLLTEFKTRETHIAIVIDEYGGTAGLVTLEDLLEEIVGEIRDEYDFFEEAPYERLSEHEYICKAGIDLDDLNELLDISLATDENDTLGGYIFTNVGRIPEVGYNFIESGVQFEVLALKGRRRISKVRVTKLTESEVTANTHES